MIACKASLSLRILQARILEWVAMPSSRGIFPTQELNQVDSLLSEPPEKPINTREGSLSLFHGIFPTQELNQCLLHCRWILYQLASKEAHIYVYTYTYIRFIYIYIYTYIYEATYLSLEWRNPV